MNHSLISRLNPASIFLLATAAAVSFPVPSLGVSGFTGVFAPTNFTLNNNDAADGSININNAASGTVILTGGNDDSFNLGTTTWITSIPLTQGGTVSFAWSFAGEQFPDSDRGGYIINGTPTYLATQEIGRAHV